MTPGAPFHPWRALRTRSELILTWLPLPGTRRGVTDGHSHIVMSPDLTQAERRCTITHELIHVERGHTSRCDPREEQAVIVEAARRLITLDDLADALLWTRNIPTLADELWVDQATVRARLEHLHPSERHYLTRRLAAREDGA